MKISKKWVETGAVLLLIVLTLYMWTLPFQENRMPYGDVDSSTHFTLADYMRDTDKPLYELPYYLSPDIPEVRGYGNLNDGKIWYPPQFHVNGAIMQILGGGRFVSFYIFLALVCSSIVFTTYFLVRKLFGFLPAFISSFMLIFSTRDILWYTWGQWPQVASFGITPLVIYAYYKYATSTLRKQSKPVYLAISILLMVTQFFFHPQGMLGSAVIMVLFTAFMIMKEKRLPFKLRHIFIILIVFAVVFLPFSNIVIGKSGMAKNPLRILTYIDQPLLSWPKAPPNAGVPQSYYSFTQMHNGIWVLPLILLGIVYLIIRRRSQELLLLAWVVQLYIMLHFFGRSERFLETEAHIFYPLIAIFIISIPQFFKLGDIRKYIKYGIAACFLILIIFTHAKPAHSLLKQSYAGLARITPYQYEMAGELRELLPERSTSLIMGTLIYTKQKWMRGLSYRSMVFDIKHLNVSDHVILDYSDILLIKDQGRMQNLQSFEQQLIDANYTRILDRDIMKVYKIG